MKQPRKDTETPDSVAPGAVLLLVLILNADTLAVTIHLLCG